MISFKFLMELRILGRFWQTRNGRRSLVLALWFATLKTPSVWQKKNVPLKENSLLFHFFTLCWFSLRWCFLDLRGNCWKNKEWKIKMRNALRVRKPQNPKCCSQLTIYYSVEGQRAHWAQNKKKLAPKSKLYRFLFQTWFLYH